MRRIIGRVRADVEAGDGFFNLAGWFNEAVDPCARDDILRDIKYAVDAAYEQAVKDMRPKHLRETEH